MAQQVKNLPIIQETEETQVQSLGGEDPLEEEMATHSSVLAWRNPWTEEPGGLHSVGWRRVRHAWVTERAASSNIRSEFKFPWLSLKLSLKKREKVFVWNRIQVRFARCSWLTLPENLWIATSLLFSACTWLRNWVIRPAWILLIATAVCFTGVSFSCVFSKLVALEADSSQAAFLQLCVVTNDWLMANPTTASLNQRGSPPTCNDAAFVSCVYRL